MNFMELKKVVDSKNFFDTIINVERQGRLAQLPSEVGDEASFIISSTD